MFSQEVLAAIIDVIHHYKKGFTPQVGLVLGSGLGPLADEITDATVIPYENLPNMHVSTVHGHAGELVLGYLEGVPVACLKGRVHYYEGAENYHFKLLIRLLKVLGCTSLIITNAAGSLRPEVGPGELVMINDHINFQHGNPLIGLNDDEFGERFFAVDNLYDATLREKFHEAANDLKIDLHEGVYVSVLGPNFETPAEIRAFKLLGADLVGMSTVPEVLVACHCGLQVTAISAVTNLAAGLSQDSITHKETLHYGQIAAEKLKKLVRGYLKKLK